MIAESDDVARRPASGVAYLPAWLGQRDVGGIAFAVVFAGILAHIWFASTPLPLAGPNILLAALAVLLAACSLLQTALRTVGVAVVRQRLAPVLPVLALATLLTLWALVVYLANDTLDSTRLGKMALGVGVMVAVFLCVENSRRAHAMVFVLAAGVFVSALGGFAVVFVGEPFLGMWLRIANVPEEELQEMLLFGRIAGIAAHISTFGRQLAVAIPLALAALLYSDWGSRPWHRRIILTALFVLLMTLVTGMLMNVTRSVWASVGAVSAVVFLLALRSPGARRRLLAWALPAAMWLLLYFHFVGTTGDDAEAVPPVQVGVEGEIQDLAVGEGLAPGDPDVVSHEFGDLSPGVQYDVELREYYAPGYGQASGTSVRVDGSGTFRLSWRRRPVVTLHQYRVRRSRTHEWSVWEGFVPALATAVNQEDASLAVHDLVFGHAWPPNRGDERRIGYRIAGLEPGASYEGLLYQVARRPYRVSSRRVPVDVDTSVSFHATAGNDGALVMTWPVPAHFGVAGYSYRLCKREQGVEVDCLWEVLRDWRPLEPFLRVIAPPEQSLRSVGVGGGSLVGRGESARVGHTFGGFIPWLWYVVQVRRVNALGDAEVVEVSVKPDEGGRIVVTWRAANPASEILRHEFRARVVSDERFSPWQSFAPSLSSRVPTLVPVPVTSNADAVSSSREGRIRRHTLEGLSHGFEYRGQLRARNDFGNGPETPEIAIEPDADGVWTFAWQEQRDAWIAGYQFRLWWLAKDRWRPWQDFVPTADGTGRTSVALAANLDRQALNVAAARTMNLLGGVAKPTHANPMTYSLEPRLHELATVWRFVAEHPWGTGVYAPQLAHVQQGLEDWVVDDLLRLWPHNQFLHVLALFGWLGVALLLAFYGCVLRCVFRCTVFAWRAGDSNFRFLAIGVTGAWAAYSINSMLIPAGPFLEGWSHFYLLGLLFAVERIVRRESAAAGTEFGSRHAEVIHR